MELVHGLIKFITVLFIKIAISYRSISAVCYIYHHSYGTCDIYIAIYRPLGTSNFSFTVVVKVSVFTSKF